MRSYELTTSLNEDITLSAENAIKRAWLEKFAKHSTTAYTKLEIELIAKNYFKDWLRYKTFGNVDKKFTHVKDFIHHSLDEYGFENDDWEWLLDKAGLSGKLDLNDDNKKLSDRAIYKLCKAIARWLYFYTDVIEQTRKKLKRAEAGKGEKTKPPEHKEKPGAGSKEKAKQPAQKKQKAKPQKAQAKKKPNLNKLSDELDVNITPDSLYGLLLAQKLGYLHKENDKWIWHNSEFWNDVLKLHKTGKIAGRELNDAQEKVLKAFEDTLAKRMGKPAQLMTKLEQEYGYEF